MVNFSRQIARFFLRKSTYLIEVTRRKLKSLCNAFTLNWISLIHICGNFVSFLQNVKFPEKKFFIFFCFVLTQFYRRQTVEWKCFQSYMSNLGIMGGFFCNFIKSLIFYHLTFRHQWIIKLLSFISKTCILAHIECRTLKFRHRNSSSVGVG